MATAAVTTELPLAVRWALAIVGGGGAAGLVQLLTSFARLKSTALTGGAGNPVLATVELLGSLLTSVLALVLPLLALGRRCQPLTERTPSISGLMSTYERHRSPLIVRLLPLLAHHGT